jgi:hypothetical protein
MFATNGIRALTDMIHRLDFPWRRFQLGFGYFFCATARYQHAAGDQKNTHSTDMTGKRKHLDRMTAAREIDQAGSAAATVVLVMSSE